MAENKVFTIRVINLRKLIEQEGSVSALSKRLKISPIYFYNILDGSSQLQDPMARNIETMLHLEPGALDSFEEIAAPVSVPLLSLTQRITKSVKATRSVEGKEVNVARANISPALREELIEGILDNLELLAQNRRVSMLNHDKANLLRLVVKRLIANDVEVV